MRVPACGALIVLCLARSAGAGIYSFVDAHGVAHFSNVPSDPHYRPIAGLREPAEDASPAPATLLERSQPYDRLIEEAARGADVDAQLVRAVIAAESAFDERAVSPRGARGLMQLMPATARRYGASDPFNPAQNIRAGARYLHDLIDRYDANLELALAAYNAGENAVDRHRGTVPPYRETRAYVPRVLGLYTALRQRADST